MKENRNDLVMIHMRNFNSFEMRNLTFLTQKSIEYTLVQITETGYKKSILDATDPMREYFKRKGNAQLCDPTARPRT